MKNIMSFCFLIFLIVGCTYQSDEPIFKENNSAIIENNLDKSENGTHNYIEITDSMISKAYYYRGEYRFQKGEYENAIIDFIIALSIDKNINAYTRIFEFPKNHTNLIVEKLTDKFNRNPNEAKWPCYIGKVYYHNDDFEAAKYYFENAYSIDGNPVYLKLMEDCQAKIEEKDTLI